MKIRYLFILMFFTVSASHAQRYDVKLFDGRIKRNKELVDERMHEYKGIQKEYQAYIKERKKQYRTAVDALKNKEENSSGLDSLKTVLSTDSIKQLLKLQEDYFVYTDSLFKLEDMALWENAKKSAKAQSIDEIKQKMEGEETLGKYGLLKKQVDSYKKTLKIYRDSLQSIDSLDREEIRFMVEQKKKELAMEYEEDLESIVKEMVNEKEPQLPGEFKNKQLDEFKNANSYLADGNGKDGAVQLATAQAGNLFEDKPEVLEKAMAEVAKLKKIYSEVPDANDLSTATKAKSLEGRQLKDRLVFGGSFQLYMDGDTNIDLNPELSYRVNKKFELGAGGTYQLTVASKELPNAVARPHVLGVRAFAKHQLLKQFYVHGEYEGLRSSMQQHDGQTKRDWYFSVLAGLERRFRLKGKAYGSALLLYNFSSKENPLYGSPWVFRVGFGVVKRD